MRKTVWYCDRCRKKLGMGHRLQVSGLKAILSGWRSFDLCDKCEHSFQLWVRNKEADDAPTTNSAEGAGNE